MNGYRISEVAERTGFSAPTLRYYEEIGLVRPPARSDAGYRRYDEQAVDRLRFIARAKRLGLTLDEITGLVECWDAEECAPVQARLRDLLLAKQDAAREQIEELERFVHELARVADRLGVAAAPGAGDATCACVADEQPESAIVPVALSTVARGQRAEGAPIVCTLGADEMPERVDEWRRLAEHVNDRTETPHGLSVWFDRGVTAAEVAELATKERACCSFFSFTVRIDARGTGLEITAPPEAQELVAQFFREDR
jgi:MerR family copper efflux transcriptional regulator